MALPIAGVSVASAGVASVPGVLTAKHRKAGGRGGRIWRGAAGLESGDSPSSPVCRGEAGTETAGCRGGGVRISSSPVTFMLLPSEGPRRR